MLSSWVSLEFCVLCCLPASRIDPRHTDSLAKGICHPSSLAPMHPEPYPCLTTACLTSFAPQWTSQLQRCFEGVAVLANTEVSRVQLRPKASETRLSKTGDTITEKGTAAGAAGMPQPEESGSALACCRVTCRQASVLHWHPLV